MSSSSFARQCLQAKSFAHYCDVVESNSSSHKCVSRVGAVTVIAFMIQADLPVVVAAVVIVEPHFSLVIVVFQFSSMVS